MKSYMEEYMSIKDIIKTNAITRPVYSIYKRNKIKNKFRFHGQFIDRSTGSESLCIILAGYKQFLYKDVFERIERFIPKNIDVCVVTSGLYSKEMELKCANNSWSYLSTKENNVNLVQNIAIQKHPKAKWIYKLDEDIFITANYFEKMMVAFNVAKEGKFNPGIIAPIIPLNGYGFNRILEKLGIEDIYEKMFGKIKIAASENIENTVAVETSSDIAKFFWGEGNYVPKIDEINTFFEKEDVCVLPCPIKFSIGAILFERSLWESMGYFDVNLHSSAMGADEAQLNRFCNLHSKPIMVSENVVVGHFSFGQQTSCMKEYYINNIQKFSIG